MRDWRNAVFARDDWTCQKTGIRGCTLHAHHLDSFHARPELRFDVDNGATLSKSAHIEFHNLYGRKNNTREQYEEWIANSCPTPSPES